MIILIAEKFCQKFFSRIFQPKPPGLYGEPTSASAAKLQRTPLPRRTYYHDAVRSSHVLCYPNGDSVLGATRFLKYINVKTRVAVTPYFMGKTLLAAEAVKSAMYPASRKIEARFWPMAFHRRYP